MHYLLPIALALVCGVGIAEGRDDPARSAARHFAGGQALFGQGRYPEALRAFEEAQRLAPHPSALFNMARCHENLGNPRQALALYQRSLASTTDPTDHADIERRIAGLRALPVKVFVSSLPSGATVTVDGRARPEPGRTPLVLRLPPGDHVLLLRREGHRLAARRLVLEPGREQPVEIRLEPLPAACLPPAPPCPAVRPCPELRLTDAEGLHLHLGLLGAFGLTTHRPLSGGPGLLAHATFRRWLFGGHFQFFPMADVPSTTEKFARIQPRWILAQVEGGRVFAFRTAYLYTVLGVGLSADRILYVGRDRLDDIAKERFAFSWSAGGGIEALAASWVSFGVGLRVGMGIGSRSNTDDPDAIDPSNVFPLGLIWGTAIFHL